jgi:hypothetical protein
MATTSKSPKAPPAKPGSATRAIAPMIPLAVALLGGHLLSTKPPSPVPPPPPAATTTASPVAKHTSSTELSPLLSVGKPVDWWLMFKFNAGSFPECSGGDSRACPFGGTVQGYNKFSQQFAYASSQNHALQMGSGCAGDTTTDPLGATFEQVYNGTYFYVMWNDQFYGDPVATKASPAGHSKGMLAWDNDGNGFVMQVSTPSWPAAGNSHNPRQSDGNTLGCVKDNDVLVSQHFFALKLTKSDVVQVLQALENASVVTDTSKPQIVNNGGPQEISTLVVNLGKNSTSKNVAEFNLSNGVKVISKSSGLHVPPWQMVSAQLGGEPLRVATWWANPQIASTTATSTVGCWDSTLAKPGAVDIATSGTFNGTAFGLEGQAEPEGNHAKIGVSTGKHTYAIFGDLNQQGSLSGPNCGSSQNGRGGLFYVMDDAVLQGSVTNLIKGDSAPAAK